MQTIKIENTRLLNFPPLRVYIFILILFNTGIKRISFFVNVKFIFVTFSSNRLKTKAKLS